MTLTTEQMKRLADSVRNGTLGPSPKQRNSRFEPKPPPKPGRKQARVGAVGCPANGDSTAPQSHGVAAPLINHPALAEA
jgi:hypothetical protein